MQLLITRFFAEVRLIIGFKNEILDFSLSLNTKGSSGSQVLTTKQANGDLEHRQRSKKPSGKNRTKPTAKNALSLETLADDNSFNSTQRECPFNPCNNGGTCFLTVNRRFTCSCRKFFYGMYCDYRKLGFILKEVEKENLS